MLRKYVRQTLSIMVILATIAIFVRYFMQHPRTLSSLSLVRPMTVALLLLLYIVFIATLVWIQRATLELCAVRLGRGESWLLMMYSAVVNFFGPLQSGPAFRAAYLKRRHDANLKKYALATLLYYGLYAAFSGLLLLVCIVGWRVILIVPVVIAAAPLVRRMRRFASLDLAAIRNLAAATLVQSAVQSAIYFVELHSLVGHVSYSQALTYTGAANFALFVSLTPGAIGFRESFLLLAQRLHHISSGTIAVASLIDRAVYISLLIVFAVIIFGFHIQKRLQPAAGSMPEK